MTAFANPNSAAIMAIRRQLLQSGDNYNQAIVTTRRSYDQPANQAATDQANPPTRRTDQSQLPTHRPLAGGVCCSLKRKGPTWVKQLAPVDAFETLVQWGRSVRCYRGPTGTSLPASERSTANDTAAKRTEWRAKEPNELNGEPKNLPTCASTGSRLAGWQPRGDPGHHPT